MKARGGSAASEGAAVDAAGSDPARWQPADSHAGLPRKQSRRRHRRGFLQSRQRLAGALHPPQRGPRRPLLAG